MIVTVDWGRDVEGLRKALRGGIEWNGGGTIFGPAVRMGDGGGVAQY
jgi:hypothetical protein